MAHEPISAEYFINPFHQSLCLYVYPLLSLLEYGSVIPPFSATQRLSIHVPAAMNPYSKIEKMLDTVFSTAICVVLNTQYVVKGK
jgi:hypothetical protein